MDTDGREFVAFISEVPRIEIAHGVVHIKDRSGNRTIDRAMSVKTFQRHLERCQKALERFGRGEDHIVVD